MAIKQVVGHPTILTESSWVATTLVFQSEGPFLTSVYLSLTGSTPPTGSRPTLSTTAPVPTSSNTRSRARRCSGVFPAAALLFRKGYVKRGEPVVHEERTLESMWERQVPLIAEDPRLRPQPRQGPAHRAQAWR